MLRKPVLRRLYLQIYLTIILSLVFVAIASGLIWGIFGHERANRYIYETTSRFVSLMLPPASAPKLEQSSSLERLGRELDLDISMYDQNGNLIANYGKITRLNPRRWRKSGLHRRRGGPILKLNLSDGRWIVADTRRHRPGNPIIYLLGVLGVVTICVGVAAYPITRRITKRLEELQKGVDSIGAGELSARVHVHGKDEVAQLAKSFNSAAQKIEKLVNANRMLLANASHELRTPLSRIRLGLELNDQERTPERQAALKQDIAELDELIDEILLMSKLDSGLPSMAMQSVDLIGLVAEECARHDNCSFNGKAPEITGDPRLLQRMLRNLIENALKHGAPPVDVKLDSTQKFAIITVSDNGNGISEADIDKVFEPFYRGSGQQNKNGYGLGLPLVKQIAEAHNGSVELVPKIELKSAIQIKLPV